MDGDNRLHCKQSLALTPFVSYPSRRSLQLDRFFMNDLKLFMDGLIAYNNGHCLG